MGKEQAKLQFVFSKRNYMLLIGGIVVVLLGFFLMSGGGSEDPDEFLGDYTLNDGSFEQMSESLEVEEAVTASLQSIKDKTFSGEDELLAEAQGLISQDQFDQYKDKINAAIHVDARMFSARRITIAPLVVLLGYAFIMYAILHKARKPEEAA